MAQARCERCSREAGAGKSVYHVGATQAEADARVAECARISAGLDQDRARARERFERGEYPDEAADPRDARYRQLAERFAEAVNVSAAQPAPPHTAQDAWRTARRAFEEAARTRRLEGEVRALGDYAVRLGDLAIRQGAGSGATRGNATTGNPMWTSSTTDNTGNWRPNTAPVDWVAGAGTDSREAILGARRRIADAPSPFIFTCPGCGLAMAVQGMLCGPCAVAHARIAPTPEPAPLLVEPEPAAPPLHHGRALVKEKGA